VCTSIEGLWILMMLLIRPGAALLMLYCSASRTRSFLRCGESGGYNGITIPPCRIGCGAYGASLVAPAAGTFSGGGTAGSVVADGFDESCAKPILIDTTTKQKTSSGLFMQRILASRDLEASAFSDDTQPTNTLDRV